MRLQCFEQFVYPKERENITDASAVSVIVTIQKSAATYARFEVNQPFILRCGSSSSQSVQACDVKYIP